MIESGNNTTVVDAVRFVPAKWYYYNQNCMLAKIQDGAVKTEFTYDGLGREKTITDTHSLQVVYDYDGLGRRSELAYPTNNPANPFRVGYAYDNYNRLTDILINTTTSLDENWQTVASYQYDSFNRREKISYAGGTEDTITWHYEDKNSESDYIVSNVTNQCVNGSLAYDYTYDNVGNILTRKENGQAVLDKYEYDNIYQLQKTWYDYNPGTNLYDLNVIFNYDSLGNRQNVQYSGSTNGTDTYNFTAGNKLNQYNSVQYYSDPASRSILYDANGNMTQLGNKAFTYDARNRMITAVNSEVSPAVQAQYQYDSMNRRISKTVGSSTIKYCYDGGQIIAEYDGANTLLRRFVYGPGIDEPICMIAYNSGGTETGRYFYHYDGQGNIVGLSNSSGNLVEQYKYDVYGLVAISCLNPNNQQWESSPVSCAGNPYFFTGRELDDETGLYYYRARMYSPGLGRFMQPDPIGYADGMNIYAYCGNNPVNFVDPLGLGQLHTDFIKNPAERALFDEYIHHFWKPENGYEAADDVSRGLLQKLYKEWKGGGSPKYGKPRGSGKSGFFRGGGFCKLVGLAFTVFTVLDMTASELNAGEMEEKGMQEWRQRRQESERQRNQQMQQGNESNAQNSNGTTLGEKEIKK